MLRCRSATSLASEEFTLTIELLDEDGRVASGEVFDSLALDPAHPRYGPTIVGGFDRAADESARAGLSDLLRLSDLTRDDNGLDLAGAADLRLSRVTLGLNRALADGDDDLANVNIERPTAARCARRGRPHRYPRADRDRRHLDRRGARTLGSRSCRTR